MQRNAWLTLTLGAILFLAHPAHAQLIGDRMRIKTEDGEKFTGQLKGYNADSLILLTNSTELSIAYADMARLKRSLGGRSRYTKRILIGLSAGVVAGGLVAASSVTGTFDQFATVAGIGLFGGTGGLVNAVIRREHWERLDIPGQSAAPVTPVIGVQPPDLSALENRMRITTENGEKLTGQLKRYDTDSLTILTDFTEQSIAYADMARLQKSLGIRSYSRDGAKMGLLVGAGGSIAAAAILREPGVLLGTIVIAPPLGLGGMISGAAIRRERWERLDIPRQGAAPVVPDLPDRKASAIRPDIGVQPPGLSALENRMRITTENGEELIGRMKEYDAVSLTILTDSTEQSIAYADMVRLQRSLGTRSRFLKGTAIGFGTGTVAGFFAASRIECNNEACVGEAFAAIAMLALGTGGGTLLGAIVGAKIKRERWERVDIPGQSAAAGMSITPTIGVHPGGGLGLGARISF